MAKFNPALFPSIKVRLPGQDDAIEVIQEIIQRRRVLTFSAEGDVIIEATLDADSELQTSAVVEGMSYGGVRVVPNVGRSFLIGTGLRRIQSVNWEYRPTEAAMVVTVESALPGSSNLSYDYVRYSDPAPDSFTYSLNEAPVVDDFDPKSGGDGTAITILGSHFTGTQDVRVGKIDMESFIIVGDNQIDAIAPTPITTGNVVVENWTRGYTRSHSLFSAA